MKTKKNGIVHIHLHVWDVQTTRSHIRRHQDCVVTISEHLEVLLTLVLRFPTVQNACLEASLLQLSAEHVGVLFRVDEHENLQKCGVQIQGEAGGYSLLACRSYWAMDHPSSGRQQGEGGNNYCITTSPYALITITKDSFTHTGGIYTTIIIRMKTTVNEQVKTITR